MLINKNVTVGVVIVVGLIVGMFFMVDHIATLAAEKAVVMILGPKTNKEKPPSKDQFEQDWEKGRQDDSPESSPEPDNKDDEAFRE